MLRTIFKNIGQGDTIILEWEKNGQLYIGIIDCKLDEVGRNPVIDHLERAGNYKLYFIVLSHPHEDHCIGVLQLMDYLQQNDIRVYRFSISFQVHKDYFDKGLKAAEKLARRIYLRSRELTQQGIFIDGGLTSLDMTFRLRSDLELRCLSPSSMEINKYQELVDFTAMDSRQGNAAANWLSTILKLQAGKEDLILFTSDAQKKSFERLMQRHPEEFEGLNLRLGQIPHHGSKANYHDEFWREMAKAPNCPAAISVGDNSYGHPSLEIIESLTTMGYRVTCTNWVNGSEAFQPERDDKLNSLLLALDDISEPITELVGKNSDFTFTLT